MLRKLLTFAVLTASVVAVAAEPNNPQGWTSLVQAIKGTRVGKISDLKGRTFELTLPSATADDTLEVSPVEAFKIDRTSVAKFQITIVNPEALVESDSTTAIITYRAIGWRVVQTGSTPFGTAIEGQVSCRYQMRFRQAGANALDLSKFKADEYVVSWELSNLSQIDTVERDEVGLILSRSAGATAPVSLRLRIKKNNGSLDLKTDWIPIPACSIPANEPTIVATPIPEPPVNVQNAPPPEECFSTKINSIARCPADCDGFKLTLDVTVTNRCARFVRCNNMTWQLIHESTTFANTKRWVALNGDSSHTFKVELQAARELLPFSINGPNNATCRYE